MHVSNAADDLRSVVSYPADAVLEIGHVAAALGVSVSMVEKLDLPCVFLGPHTRRFLWSEVLATLKARGKAA